VTDEQPTDESKKKRKEINRLRGQAKTMRLRAEQAKEDAENLARAQEERDSAEQELNYVIGLGVKALLKVTKQGKMETMEAIEITNQTVTKLRQDVEMIDGKLVKVREGSLATVYCRQSKPKKISNSRKSSVSLKTMKEKLLEE